MFEWFRKLKGKILKKKKTKKKTKKEEEEVK
jgi:hypothetical protein